MSHPTPTTHGDWHVIDGQLVDLSASLSGTGTDLVPLESTGEPLIASTEEREGDPGIAVPPADAPHPSAANGRRKTQSKESPNGTA